MEKATIQRHYDYLSGIYDDYYFASERAKNDRLKKDREKASNNQSNIIHRCERYIQNNPELFDFYISKNTTDFGKVIIWDEFFSLQWFGRDLSDLLEKMKNILEKDE